MVFGWVVLKRFKGVYEFGLWEYIKFIGAYATMRKNTVLALQCPRGYVPNILVIGHIYAVTLIP